MIRQDALTPLRVWAAGYVAGASVAACSEFVAIELEARALLALDRLGVTRQVHAIFDQARLEARLAAPPETSEHDVRALAAQRILLLLERCVLARTKREAA